MSAFGYDQEKKNEDECFDPALIRVTFSESPFSQTYLGALKACYITSVLSETKLDVDYKLSSVLEVRLTSVEVHIVFIDYERRVEYVYTPCVGVLLCSSTHFRSTLPFGTITKVKHPFYLKPVVFTTTTTRGRDVGPELLGHVSDSDYASVNVQPYMHTKVREGPRVSLGRERETQVGEGKKEDEKAEQGGTGGRTHEQPGSLESERGSKTKTDERKGGDKRGREMKE
ncbi:hypothetical protein BC826DRAFT_970912 [Russula brevipes]|nr:hypothetical protein BC826DRAFT_970912 [Russula brevipes]